MLKRMSAVDMNALALALLRPKSSLEICSERLLMLFRAIRSGARGFALMDAVRKGTLIAELETKVAEDKEYWVGV
jgi:hypothetical protein